MRNRFQRGLAVCGCVLVFTPVLSTAAEPIKRPPLRLEDLETAAKTFPSIAAIGHAIEIAEARLTEAQIAPYTQFTASAGITTVPQLRGSPTFSPDSQVFSQNLKNGFYPAYRLGVEGVIPIYTFGKITGAQDAARAGIRASKWDKQRALKHVQYDVRRGYFGLRVALDLKDMLEEGQDKLDGALASMEQKLKEQKPEATPGEEPLEMGRWRIASALAEIAGRVSEVLRAEGSSRAALSALTNIREIEVLECPMEAVAYTLQPLPRYVDVAVKQKPELQMLAAAISARRADAGIKTAMLMPDLGVSLGYTYSRAPGITDQTNPFIQDPNFFGPYYGLGARWSLDFGGNLARKKQADEAVKQIEMQFEEARRGVEIEISLVYYQIEDAVRRAKAWSKGRKEGRAWFVAAAQGYQLGTVEARILIDSVRAYFTAKANYLSAVQDLNTGLANLERSIGAPIMERSKWDPPCEE